MASRTTFNTRQHRELSLTNDLVVNGTLSELKFVDDLNGKILLTNVTRPWLANQSAGAYDAQSEEWTRFKLTNLADGIDIHDAVNVGQLSLKLDRSQLVTEGDVEGYRQVNWATVTDQDIPSALAVRDYLTTSAVVIMSEEVPAGAINGINTQFTTTQNPIPGSLMLYLNGQRLRAGLGNDFTYETVADVTTITMSYAPEEDDQLITNYTYNMGAESVVVSFTTTIDFGTSG